MKHDFDPRPYGQSFAQAIGDEPRMPLDAGRPDVAKRDLLAALPQQVAQELDETHRVVDPSMLHCCCGAVWLLHGFLDDAHAIFQDAPSATGSYWHGVVHRREGDYGNAAYWFRRAGDHPIAAVVASAAAQSHETVELARGGRWDAIGFVEAVRSSIQDGAKSDALLQLQRAEWRALFDFCWRRALDS